MSSVNIASSQQGFRNTASVNERTLKEFYDLTMQFFNQGVTLEENKRPKEAMEQYEQGIQLATQILQQYNSHIPQQMKEQLNKYKGMFEGRLQDLRQELQPKAAKWTSSMWSSLFQPNSKPPQTLSNGIDPNLPLSKQQQQTKIHQSSLLNTPLLPSSVQQYQQQAPLFQSQTKLPPTSQQLQQQVKSSQNSSSSKANAAASHISQIPEFKSIDKKLLDHILNEVIDSKASTKWEDIAGLHDAKQTLYETVILPAMRPDLFQGLRSPAKGILLFGPPGNGKTMIAKAVSSQCNSTFFSISASSLVSKYHGEGEKLVRALFAAARYLQPSVIFIDEVDSILSSRSSEEHEASKRMKTEFLVQMDGATTSQQDRVLVMGATNLPYELDGAILRRFTKRIYIPLPDAAARGSLIRHLMSSHRVQLNEKQLQILSDQLTNGFSGSDLHNLCKEVAIMPIRELNPQQLLHIKAEDVRPIQFKDFEAAVKLVRPTVSKELLKQLEEWNKNYGSFANRMQFVKKLGRVTTKSFFKFQRIPLHRSFYLSHITLQLDTKLSQTETKETSKASTNTHTEFEKDENGYTHFKSIRNNHLFFTIPFTSLKIRWSYISLLLLCAILVKLYFSIEEAPVTHRKRLLLLSNDFFMEEADSIIKHLKPATLPATHPDQILVSKLGQQIARACTSEMDNLPKWEFIVVEMDESNAFALSNGKVVVFTGLLNTLERNREQLAGVLCHEIAHVLMDHVREGIAFSSVIHISSFFIRSFFTFHVPQSLVNFALELPHSREQEYEADLIGTLLMARANFNPLGLAAGFEKMASIEETETLEYMSTHPSFEHRIERIKQFAVKAVELKRKYPNTQIRKHWYDGFESKE